MITIEHSNTYLNELAYREYLQLNKGFYNLRIQILTITECYSGVNFINLINILHTSVDGLTLENSADDNESIDDLVNEFTLNDFKNLEFMGMEKGNIYPYKIDFIGFISINYIDTVSITNSLFRVNRLKTDSLLNIKNARYVNIQGATFEDIQCSSDGGGVINLSMVGDQGILIDNCTFYNITSSSSASVIEISSSKNTTMTGSSFKNIMTSLASAVLFTDVKDIKMNSCYFESLNSHSGKSAAIILERSDQVEINNSAFTQITNPSEASAIYIKHTTNALIYKSNFTDCQGGNFGTILADGINGLSIDGCIFCSVKSIFLYGAGAGIYMNYIKLGASLIIRNSIFEECLSEIGSGCVYITSTEDNLYITLTINLNDLEFIRCRAELGSAIFINNMVKIYYSSIVNIIVTFNQNLRSGPIHSTHISGVLRFIGCSFYYNQGSVAAISAMFSGFDELISLKRIDVFNNNCDIAGIYLQSLSYYTEAKMEYLSIHNNSCPGLYIYRVIVTVNNSSIMENLIGIILEDNVRLRMSTSQILKNFNYCGPPGGGGVYLQSNSQFICEDCIISDNRAYSGGGIMGDQHASFKLKRTILSNNHAEESGSAVYLKECSSITSHIEDCDISRNTSEHDATIMSILSNISIKNSRIEINVSDYSIPGIVLSSSVLTLYNTKFQNLTPVTGYFINSHELSTVNIHYCEFLYEYASINAGAVIIYESFANITNSVFKMSYSQSSLPVIVASDQSRLSIEWSDFLDLNYEYEGSAIDSYASSVRIVHTTFKGFKKTGILGNNLIDLSVFNSTFERLTGYNGGAIFCSNCDNINISGSSFFNNTATNFGGAVYLQINSYVGNAKILISSCKFLGNHSYRGGALYIEGRITYITYSTFLRNKASDEGGAAYLKCKDEEACEFKVDSTNLVQNNAAVEGGGIFLDGRKPLLYDKSIFINNTAKYGSNIASYPTKIQFLLNGELIEYSKDDTLDKPLAFTFNDVPPGQKHEEKIQIALVDHYKQIVNTDNSSYAQIFPNDTHVSSIIGTSKLVANNGIYIFKDTIIKTKPRSSIYLIITTSAVDTQKVEKAAGEESFYSSVYILINTRDCLAGESTLDDACEICDPGTYSVDPEDPCQRCPDEAECLGGYKMYPKKHYWRSNMYTDIFFECLNHDACLGSPNHESYTGECEEGYRGNLCQACENGYSRRSKNVCAECPSEDMNRFITSMVSVVIVAYCIIAVKTSIISSYKPKSLLAMYIKIFINYWQLVGITIGLEIPWPESLLQFFSNNINSSTYSFDCLLETSDPDSYIQVYYKKIVMNALLPLISIVICMMVWSIISFRKNDSRYLKIEMVATIVIILLFLHPIITEVLLSIYSCRELEGEGLYLNANLDIECWKGDHLYYALMVALPSVIIWSVGVPLGILMYLSRRKRHLKDIEMKLRFGFLYNGYKLRNYYWQFLILYRNVLVIMIIVFLSRFDINIQALACLLVLILFYYIHVIIYPHKHKKLNEIDKLGILIATITIYLALYFMTDDIHEYTKIGLSVVIIVSNCYFILIWLYHFGHSLFKNLASSVFFLRARFDRRDGFNYEFYLDPHLTKNVYIEEDQHIFTLINFKDPESENSAMSLPSDMVDLYKYKLINDSITGNIESGSSDELNHKDSILSSTRSLFTSEHETFLDSSFIQDYRIN